MRSAGIGRAGRLAHIRSARAGERGRRARSGRVWLPLPLTREAPYQRDLGSTWQSSGATMTVAETADGGFLLRADWAEATQDPSVEFVMRVPTRDIAVSLGRPRSVAPEDLTPYLRPTAPIPTDGIVRDTAVDITRGH